tara:strand:+ start:719 stop:3955 length:3237 start_codon:yes stop_codon:yes gene_type:complete
MNSDGTKLIVGTGYASSVADGESAYIYNYDGSNWDTGTKIVAPTADQHSYDNFGMSVSMSGDGTKVIVGAHREDSGGLDRAGAAYIYTYDSSSSSWGTGTKIVAFDKAVQDYFGRCVAMNSDGTRVIVGAYQEDAASAPGQAGDLSNSGSAYIYTYDSSSSSWDTGTKIVAPDRAVDDMFGWSVAMNSDGTKVIVGARDDHHNNPVNYDAGSAYIYTYSGSSWDTGIKIVAPDAENHDEFGFDVAMNGDGTKVIVGASWEDPGGAANVNAGAAYIYTYDSSSSSWDTGTKIVASDRQSSDYFGSTVSMNSDGTKVIVGAANEDPSGLGQAGSAYLFTYDGSSWDTGTKIVASDKESSDYFGASVAISGDGTKVIVGASYEDPGGISNAGSAYIYEITETTTAGFVFDASTQVFTVTGTGIVPGSTVQLEGADGTLYSVSDVTPNAAGTQVTFKMGSQGVEFPPSAMTNNDSIDGYTASASMNNGDVNQGPFYAFNDVISTGSYWAANKGNATEGYDYNSPYLAGLDSAATQDISGITHRGHWIQLQIPDPVILTRAVIGTTQSGYQHGQFVILGSNDNTNWTLLHAGTGTTLSTNVTTLSAGSTKAFSYFRVVIKSKGVGSVNHNIEINNIQFFGGGGSWDLAQQPYKVRINSTSGLSGTSTAVIGFAVGWTTAAGANLEFNIAQSQTQTLVGTDGGGGTNRTFSVAPGSNALPSGLTLTGSTGAITGQIAATGTTPMTFRLTDNGSGLFTDRAINILGVAALYPFTSHTFTNAGTSGRLGPSLATITGHADYSSAEAAGWRTNTAYFKLGNDSNGTDRDGYQLWTVPDDATYKIIATGASGAAYNNINNGYGGKIEAQFTLTKGTKLLLIVGQAASNPTSTSGGGGGGGASWVLQPATGNEYSSGSSRAIYMIAGGGGGGQSQIHGAGTTRTAGVALATSGSSTGGTKGPSYSAGGGAGFTSNGAGSSGSNGSGGRAPGNGAFGGTSGTAASYGGAPVQDGGFGGGGGAMHHEGGGGGGFRGGNVATYNTYNSNGGGKSWVSAGGNGASWPAAPTYTGTHDLNAYLPAHGSIYIEKM